VSPALKKRLPVFVSLAVAFIVWRGGFGFLASERTLTWRLPVAYGDVRKLELQVWRDEALLGRRELSTPQGLVGEPELTLAMTRGEHRGVASVWLGDAGAPVSFQKAFDPGAEAVLVIELPRSR